VERRNARYKVATRRYCATEGNFCKITPAVGANLNDFYAFPFTTATSRLAPDLSSRLA